MRHPAGAARQRSSRTSSPRNGAASAWAWRSPRRSSSSSAGTITVASEVGKGTTFILEFPGDADGPAAAGGSRRDDIWKIDHRCGSEDAMFRTLVRPETSKSTDERTSVQLLRAADARGGAALQLRGRARAARPHYRGRRFADRAWSRKWRGSCRPRSTAARSPAQRRGVAA